MSILVWSILGFVVGITAGWIVNKPGDDVIPDIVLGVIGAVVGGVLFSYFGSSGVSGLNLYSLVVAVCGAIVALVIYRAIARRTA